MLLSREWIAMALFSQIHRLVIIFGVRMQQKVSEIQCFSHVEGFQITPTDIEIRTILTTLVCQDNRQLAYRYNFMSIQTYMN